MNYRGWYSSLSDHRKITLGSLTLGTVLAAVTILVVGGERAPVSSSEADFAMSVIELAALILPAIAIVLQASLRYADSSFLKLDGGAVELRKASFLATGVGGILLFLSVFFLIRYISLPRPMFLSMVFISLVILLFSAVPLSLWWKLSDEKKEEEAKLFDVLSEDETARDISDRTEAEVEAVISAAGLEGSELAENLRSLQQRDHEGEKDAESDD